MNRRLAEFIRTEIEPILQDWEAFAKTIHHAAHMNKTGLRDHAKDMLLVIADDLDTHQNAAEQAVKSKGRGPEELSDSWAEVHGIDRQTSGFSVIETVSEFRALRASVCHTGAGLTPKLTDNSWKTSLASMKPSTRPWPNLWSNTPL